MRPIKVLMIGFSIVLSACAGKAPRSVYSPHPSLMSAPIEQTSVDSQIRVYYGEPNVKYKKVCKIEAAGSNVIETRYTKKSDFEVQFKRRARRCRGANAVIIHNMFAFEHGSAFADGAGIAIEP